MRSMYKKNYWVERTPGRVRIRSEREFKKKLRLKIVGGLVGICLGASLIVGAPFAEKAMNPARDPMEGRKRPDIVMYFFGGISALVGVRNARAYFRHKKDRRPNSAIGALLF